MHDLQANKPGKNQENQRSYDVVKYYFYICFQGADQSVSKIGVLLQKPSKIILGIDPGTVVMGYGIVLCSGPRISLVEMGVLKLPTSKDAYQRLQLIHKKVYELIQQHQPHDFAIEAPFFGKNVQSMLKLGRAQGVAIATAMHAGIPVTEYSPRKIKQSITGNGSSEKEQVWKMLQNLLSLGEELKTYDASDALAVAVCHHFQHKLTDRMASGSKTAKGDKTAKPGGATRKKAGSWEAFIRENPGKVRSR
jgi:crossover junction endodeoxyribonuclease RuvC